MTKRILYALILVGILGLAFPRPGLSQGSEELKALRKEIQDLKSGQKRLLRELGELKDLLQTRRARRSPVQTVNVVLDVKDEPFKGDKNARLTLVEFSDYECPFCSRHVRQTMAALERDYVRTGKVKYVFRDFPIPRIHKNAFKAAEAANCSGDQGKYWEIHDRIFANRRAMAPKNLLDHAQALGLEMKKFQECFEGGKYAAEIRQDVADGQKAGVRGTPTFFLGLTDPNNSKIKATLLIRGAQPYARFKQAIDGLLSSQKQ